MKYTIYTMIILLPVKGFNQKGIIVLNFVEHLTTKRIIFHILKLTIIFKTWNKKTMHRAIKLTQFAWLKPWIGLNTDFRKVAKNAFEKDYFKLMDDAVFGKTMEIVRDRIEIKTAYDAQYFVKYVSKLIFIVVKI